MITDHTSVRFCPFCWWMHCTDFTFLLSVLCLFAGNSIELSVECSTSAWRLCLFFLSTWIALCCKLCWIKYCRYTAQNDFNLSGECLFEILFTEMCFHWNAGLVLVVRWKAIAVRFGWIFELHDSVNNFVTFRIEAGSQQGRWQHGHIRWVADVSPLVSRRKKRAAKYFYIFSEEKDWAFYWYAA